MPLNKQKIKKVMEQLDSYLENHDEEYASTKREREMHIKRLERAIEELGKEGKVGVIGELLTSIKGTVLALEQNSQKMKSVDMGPLLSEIKAVRVALSRDIPTPVYAPNITVPGLSELKGQLEAFRMSLPRANPKIDISPIVKAIESLRIAFDSKPVPNFDLPATLPVAVTNFPPQKIPQPVTNINVNGLRGPVKSTAVTVTTSATELPDTALGNRRSMIIFNNSTSTVFIGGSDVTTSNGLPVPKNTYSPPVDLSDRVTLYGIVSTGTADIRVLEASMDTIGS